MAEAARSVKHYVSDFLEERYPYNEAAGFSGSHTRDAGLVFNGFASIGLDDLLNNLTNPMVGDAERCKAVHHLHARSASQEEKITLLRKGAVASVVAVLNADTSPLLEHACFQLLRSLSVVSQPCFRVVMDGGVDAALHAIENEAELRERGNAITSALHMMYQLSSNFAGLRWMLQLEGCEEHRLAGDEMQSVGSLPSCDAIVSSMVHALQNNKMPSAAVLYATGTLTQITTTDLGIRACWQSADALQTLANRLGVSIAAARADKLYADIVAQLLNVVWNIAMDHDGCERLEAHGVPEQLLRIFNEVRLNFDSAPTMVQRHLMGALSAVFKLSSMKRRSTELVDETLSRIVAIIEYVRGINRAIDASKRGGQPPSRDLVAMAKNSVQCVRLASEVQAVRAATHHYIDELSKTNPTEVFYLRRQLYYSTQWEAEYEAFV